MKAAATNSMTARILILIVAATFVHRVPILAAVPDDDRWSSLGGGVVFLRQTVPVWRSDQVWYVAKIAVDETDVYIGGDMNLTYDSVTSTSKTVRALARWDDTTWANLGDAVPLASAANCIGDAIVYDMALRGSELYVTGEAYQYICPFSCSPPFTDCVLHGSGPFLSRWDGTLWIDVGGGLVGGGAYANALAVNGNDIYVAGSFTQAGNVLAKNIARWDGTNWFPLGGGLTETVKSMSVDGQDVYAVTAQTSFTNNVWRWDGVAWSKIGTLARNAPPGQFDTTSHQTALVKAGNSLFAGGDFK